MEKKEVPKAEVFFEVSWEVCNKVGGIHTVVSSKVDEMLHHYHEYFVIGPYFPDKAKGEFLELAHPEICRKSCDRLKELGIVVHYGKWLVGKRPQALLIDFQPLFSKVDDIKRELWDRFRIDSLNADFQFDEPVVWGWAVGMVLESLSEVFADKKVVAQFHEWISGSAMLYLKSRQTSLGSVFTTHATVLGRALESDGVDLYDEKDGASFLEKIDADREAYSRNVPAKHLMEKACAHNADVFTTVSEITGLEAKFILGMVPDVIIPNGINIENFASAEECSVRHNLFRNKLFLFLMYYFFPYYKIDLEKTHLIFLAARHEIRDKGIDVFIKALARVNDKLKESRSKENIVAFFWVPTGIRGIKPEIIENRTFFEDIMQSITDNRDEIMRKLLTAVVTGKNISRETLLKRRLSEEIYSKVLRFKRSKSSPPVCTHDLMDPDDGIIRLLANENLKNSETDAVKVIYYPVYLTGADGLLNLNYHECMQGCHFGIFPSAYEPFGYTPLECASLCVTSLTTDVSGFGQFILNNVGPREKEKGIKILKRLNREETDIVDDLADIIFDYVTCPKADRIEEKFEARKLAEIADWKILIKNYIRAHNLAVEKSTGLSKSR